MWIINFVLPLAHLILFTLKRFNKYNIGLHSTNHSVIMRRITSCMKEYVIVLGMKQATFEVAVLGPIVPAINLQQVTVETRVFSASSLFGVHICGTFYI